MTDEIEIADAETDEIVDAVEETINYYCLGYNPADGKVSYLFVNPYRTADTEDNSLFKDHVRAFPVVMVDGVIDLDANSDIAESLARGVAVKMKISAALYIPEDYDDTDVLVAFGELYVAPVEDEPEDADTIETESE